MSPAWMARKCTDWLTVRLCRRCQDLKGKDVESLVVIKVLIGTNGAVRCARAASADPVLAQRSVDAARKWHYRADSLKRDMVNVESSIVFLFSNNTVRSLPPP